MCIRNFDSLLYLIQQVGVTDAATGYGIDLSEDMGLPKDTLTSVDGEIDGVTDIIHEAISSRRDRESPEPEGTGHLPVTCETLGIDPLNPYAAEIQVSAHIIILYY